MTDSPTSDPTDFIDPKSFAIAAARLAHDRHAEDIVILDLREISPITDYFVIATGTSNRQLQGLADEIGALGKNSTPPHRPSHVAGRDAAGWIVMDFFDTVVHLFDEERRGYYDLEMIWGEVPKIPWQRT